VEKGLEVEVAVEWQLVSASELMRGLNGMGEALPDEGRKAAR
jgi:hypothetical protein